MRLLLDTHALIWWMEEPDLLSTKAREAIGDPHNRIYVSAISFLEIGIKQAYGNLSTKKPFEGCLEILGFSLLPLTDKHGLGVKHFPVHHKDPFDRALVAQCQSEGLTLVTRDRRLTAYNISVLEA